MQSDVFFKDLTIVLLLAGFVTTLCHYLRLPVILGYILAGVLIGPYTPPRILITDPGSIQTLSQLGIAMLMFSLGLQFSLRGMLKVGPTAMVAATIEILLMIWVGYQVGRLFNWNQMDSVFLGAMLLSSSTVIIIKVINDLKMSEHPFAKVVFGIVVFDDMAAIMAIAVLSGIGLSGSFSPGELLQTGWNIGLFFTVVLVLGLLALPRLLRFVASFKSDEVLLVVVLGLGFGMALLAVKLGFSTALGAFLTGAIIAETREGGRIRSVIGPIRDMFSAIFFVSIGLLLDPRMVLQYWFPVAVVTVALILGKTITGAIGAFVTGNNLRTSLQVGIGLAQIGEFAFIIAALGKELGVTSDFLYPIAVSVSGITTLTTPFLIHNSDRIAAGIEAVLPRRLLQYMNFYTEWITRLASPSKHPNQVRQLLRWWVLQIALNVVLITALFISASAASHWFEPKLAVIPPWAGGPNAALFFVAMILSLPLIVATIRKLRAAAMLMAEASIQTRNSEHASRLRALAITMIVGGGTVLLLLYIVFISSAILPSLPVLILLVAIVVLVAFARWRTFIKLYAGAQVSLRESLMTPIDQELVEPPMPSLLRHAVMEVVAIGENAAVAGKLIREMNLRSDTGASIVGIERNGENIINPSADEEVKSGDRVLVIGTRAQVTAAADILTAPPKPST